MEDNVVTLPRQQLEQAASKLSDLGQPQLSEPLFELLNATVRHQRAGYDVDVPGYEQLRRVLEDAMDQASIHKGKERHANDLPFHLQPMQQIAQRRGIGFILGQADKKSEEAQGMLERGERDKAVHELLGAIVYLAGAVIHIRKQEQ